MVTYLEMGILRNRESCLEPKQPWTIEKLENVSQNISTLCARITFPKITISTVYLKHKGYKHRSDFLEIINGSCRITCCKLTKVNYEEGVGLLLRWGDWKSRRLYHWGLFQVSHSLLRLALSGWEELMVLHENLSRLP